MWTSGSSQCNKQGKFLIFKLDPLIIIVVVFMWIHLFTYFSLLYPWFTHSVLFCFVPICSPFLSYSVETNLTHFIWVTWDFISLSLSLSSFASKQLQSLLILLTISSHISKYLQYLSNSQFLNYQTKLLHYSTQLPHLRSLLLHFTHFSW